MSELDILADLEAAPRRPNGQPCMIATMRRDHPDLVAQWDAVLAAKRAGKPVGSNGDIASWFVKHGHRMTRNVVDRHLRSDSTCPASCWCAVRARTRDADSSEVI